MNVVGGRQETGEGAPSQENGELELELFSRQRDSKRELGGTYSSFGSGNLSYPLVEGCVALGEGGLGMIEG